MRKFLVAASLFLGAVALMPAPTALAAVDAAGLSQIQAILAQYPNGGDALAAAIAAAVEANPNLADDVVAASQNATPDQQTAMGTGLANAANYFANLNTPAGNAAHDEIVAAAANGPALLIASLDASITPTAGGGPGGTFGGLTQNFNNNTTHQNSCVSPSRPGPC
jgi:hypothetical protein